MCTLLVNMVMSEWVCNKVGEVRAESPLVWESHHTEYKLVLFESIPFLSGQSNFQQKCTNAANKVFACKKLRVTLHCQCLNFMKLGRLTSAFPSTVTTWQTSYGGMKKKQPECYCYSPWISAIALLKSSLDPLIWGYGGNVRVLVSLLRLLEPIMATEKPSSKQVPDYLCLTRPLLWPTFLSDCMFFL